MTSFQLCDSIITLVTTATLGILATVLPAHAAGVPLVANGKPAAVVVLPAEPEPAEQQAADELIDHIDLITGIRLNVIRPGESAGDLTPIRIGAAADDAIDELIRRRGDDPWSFALVVDSQNKAAVQLRGLSAEGTRSAAYELLEQLGVRWFMPGEIGRVVPKADTITLAAQQTIQVPSYSFRRGPGERGFTHHEAWNQRVRLGGVGGRYGAHGIRPFAGRDKQKYFDENPEFFALINGTRQRRQLCLTNSTDNLAENQVLRIVVEHYRDYLRQNPDVKVLNMGPDDGGGYCQCDHCRQLDPPRNVTTPLATPQPSLTDRYVWFFNQILEQLEDEFPTVRIGFYAYAQHIMPPQVVKPSDRLALSMAPIHACRIHGPNNPVCPEGNLAIWLYKQWQPYAEGYMADRGYLFNLACPGFPFSVVHRIREEIPAIRELGVHIWAADPASAWASHNPSMYIAAKLLWNHQADVDALLTDFYEKFYGPAAEPMAAYHTLMDQTIRDADHHTGSSWDMPYIYPPAMRQQARSLLDSAASQTAAHADPAYATRVEIVTRSLDFLDSYCDLMQRRNDHDFIGEKEAFDRLLAICNSLIEDYEYPMLLPRHAQQHIDRFIRPTTEAGYKTVTNGNEIVAPLSPQWDFFQDPESWGQYIGLHEPDSRGGNWQTIRTDTSWSNQGLRYYFGQTWYRQVVDVPDTHHGRPIHLWFSGVDNTVEVWVNGQFVGANHRGAAFDIDAYGSAFRPFEFDASEAIQRGKPNVVTIRHVRPGTNEVGTGGLIGPVMFYSPAPQ